MRLIGKCIFGSGIFALAVVVLLFPLADFRSALARTTGIGMPDIVLMVLVIIAAAAVTYGSFRFSQLSNDALWQNRDMVIPVLLILVGHLGIALAAFMLMNMRSGSASGLVLIPPMLWSFLFFGAGLIVGGRRAAKHRPRLTQEN